MIKNIALFLFILFHFSLFSQEILSDIDVADNGFCVSRSMDMVDDVIYLQSSALCINSSQDSTNCLTV